VTRVSRTRDATHTKSANLGWPLTARISTHRCVRNAESEPGVAMNNSLPPEMPAPRDRQPASNDTAFDRAPLANRLLTASEVAAFVGCHEESVRRAYLSGQLKRQRFGVRSCRFDPIEVRDWIARGAPTRIPREVHRPTRRMGRRLGWGEGGAHGCAKDLQA
jgi:predicted DNA-binding transcriptional regulator AlpA